MKKTTSDKMNHILTILVVILFAAVYLQGRQISKFTEGPDEKSRTEVNTESRSFEQSVLQDGEEAYQKKIAQLEIKITKMQKLQDHLEDILEKYEEKDDFADTDLPENDAVLKAKEDFVLRKNFFKQYKDFFDQNNYPPEINDSLFDLYIERHTALDDFIDNAQKAGAENIRANAKKLNRQIEEISAEYDEKTEELLSEDGLALFKEYEHRGLERAFINGLQDMLGNDKIEKEKEKELIAMMYNYRQSSRKKQQKKAQSYKINRDGPDEKTMARLQKDNLEYNIKLYENYASLAEGILSESQMDVFEGLLNVNKASFINNSKNIPGSDKEKGEE